MNAIAERLATVRQQIDRAARAAGHPVTLIAVSKRHPCSAIRDAVEAGQMDMGENYAQELADKRSELGDTGIRWHFIGHLQRNKAKLVLGCALIHTVDRVELVHELDRRAQALEIDQAVLIQVNIAGEPGKSGIPPEGVPALLDAFAQCQHVHCRGLMLIPPLADPEATRPHFRALAHLRDRLSARNRPRVELAELSMGMSHDFEVAIAEGATMVRVGTAIFGERPN